jgi:ferrous iron transport protein A
MQDATNFCSPINLSEASDQAELKIVLIAGGWGIRRHLNQIGIQPGDHVRVVRRAPFGGPVLIENHGTQVAVGRGMAENIRVEVLP